MKNYELKLKIKYLRQNALIIKTYYKNGINKPNTITR